jgi:hypothetical protein
MTPEQLARAEERLRHPAPGSKIEAAQKYGVDLTLLIEQLRRTPAERARKLQGVANSVAKIRDGRRRSV